MSIFIENQHWVCESWEEVFTSPKSGFDQNSWKYKTKLKLNKAYTCQPFMGLVLVIFTLLLTCQEACAGYIALDWMDDPERLDSVLATDGESGLYIDIVSLSANLDIHYSISPHQERIRLDMPHGRLIFTKGLPFVMIDGKLHQMPLPVSTDKGGFLAPVEPLVDLLAEFYPGEIYFDPRNSHLLVSQPAYDILGLRFIDDARATKAIITAGSGLVCRTKMLDDGGVRLQFPDATLDTALLNQAPRYGRISRVIAEQDGRDAVITLLPDSVSAFSQLDRSDDPPLYAAVFVEYSEAGPDPKVARRLEEERSQWEMDVVVIDAGHGGRDPGAVGKSKLYEKDVTLDVALRLRKALEKRGVKIVMTRDRDVFVPLSNRTKIANESGGKLFVSLHCNSARDRRARGIETYFLSPTKTERAMNVAMRENSVIKYEESQEQYRDLTEENFILLSMAQANFVRESQDLAAVVQNHVSRGVELKNRGVDQAGFYVLIGASMPAVLFEMGFISHKEEEKKLNDKNFRQQMADQICEAIIKFLNKSQ